MQAIGSSRKVPGAIQAKVLRTASIIPERKWNSTWRTLGKARKLQAEPLLGSNVSLEQGSFKITLVQNVVILLWD